MGTCKPSLWETPDLKLIQARAKLTKSLLLLGPIEDRRLMLRPTKMLVEVPTGSFLGFHAVATRQSPIELAVAGDIPAGSFRQQHPRAV